MAVFSTATGGEIKISDFRFSDGDIQLSIGSDFDWINCALAEKIVDHLQKVFKLPRTVVQKDVVDLLKESAEAFRRIPADRRWPEYGIRDFLLDELEGAHMLLEKAE